MRDSKISRIVLFCLGALLVGIGAWRLFDPVSFFANSGLTLADHPGLLSEARAAGGAVVGFGLLTLAGAFVPRLAFTSNLVAVVLFYGFAAARLIGLALDGNPGEMVIQGLVIELVLGSVAFGALLWFREGRGG